MRSIRNATVAGVTALAVSLSGVQAFAADTPEGNISSDLSPKYQGEKAVTGQDAFGSHTLDDKDLPPWFTAWKGFTIAGIVLTILTNLIAPAYNYLKFNGII